MSEHDSITCSKHGEGYATFVCEHLLGPGSRKFYCEPETAEEPWPGGWCEVCHQHYLVEGEWNDRSEAAANLGEIVQAICHQCYGEVKGRHRVEQVEP